MKQVWENRKPRCIGHPHVVRANCTLSWLGSKDNGRPKIDFNRHEPNEDKCKVQTCANLLVFTESIHPHHHPRTHRPSSVLVLAGNSAINYLNQVQLKLTEKSATLAASIVGIIIPMLHVQINVESSQTRFRVISQLQFGSVNA